MNPRDPPISEIPVSEYCVSGLSCRRRLERQRRHLISKFTFGLLFWRVIPTRLPDSPEKVRGIIE